MNTMAATDFRTQAPAHASVASTAILRAVALFDDAVAGLRVWRRTRATEKALAELTDTQLHDIGLHRGAIPGVAEALARR
jgi:uncharacterized protein YjiS (DUF1127 family)